MKFRSAKVDEVKFIERALAAQAIDQTGKLAKQNARQ